MTYHFPSPLDPPWCDECGSNVGSIEKHDQFHQRLELLQTLAMEANSHWAPKEL